MKPMFKVTLLATLLALPAQGAPGNGPSESTTSSNQSQGAQSRRIPLTEDSQAGLGIAITPYQNGQPLTFDTGEFCGPGGRMLSVTRLDLLLSNIALHREGAGWLELTNRFAYLSLREGRTQFELNNLPAHRYDRIRFQVGVPPAVNHAHPATYGPTHLLNPNVNGLHWNWQGGYVFAALEGFWRRAAPREAVRFPDLQAGAAVADSARTSRQPNPDAAGDMEPSGYSFHIATDQTLMTVELPVELDLALARQLLLGLHVDRIFSSPHPNVSSEETASTHSREDDPLADRLRMNIERAFQVREVVAIQERSMDERIRETLDMSPHATPYRFTVSRSFPQPRLPLDNPITEEGVYLGALLFCDPRLSSNNSQSCSSCHSPEAAFTDGKTTSIGAEGQIGTRNAMPLFNLAWKSSFFWDGRAATLREQVLQPIQNPMEMNETLTNVVEKLRRATLHAAEEIRAARLIADRSTRNPNSTQTGTKHQRGGDYQTLFERAFGTPQITADRMARALEQFLLTRVSYDSKFDRSLRGAAELTREERRGAELFHTEYDPRRRQFGADCFHCHGGPLFQNQTFANNGLDAEPVDPGQFG